MSLTESRWPEDIAVIEQMRGDGTYRILTYVGPGRPESVVTFNTLFQGGHIRVRYLESETAGD